ncbi:MAG: hypothetical protein PHW53_02535 [Patescibacteria group bacterium]|nr:hypothetical protein [Patescibacteria group bacterium]
MPETGAQFESYSPQEFKAEKKGPPPIPEAAKRRMPPPLPEAARAKARAAEEAQIEEIREDIGIAENSPEIEKSAEATAYSLKGDHEKNEDALAAGDNYVLVADGMGGQMGGYEASHTIRDTVKDFYKRHDALLRDSAAKGDQKTIEESLRNLMFTSQKEMATFAALHGDDLRADKSRGAEAMGATFSMMHRWTQPGEKGILGFGKKEPQEKVTVAHMGDSRVMRLRGGKMERLTRDSSPAQFLIDEGIFPDDQSTDTRYTLEELDNIISQKFPEPSAGAIKKMVLGDILEKGPRVIKQGYFSEEGGAKKATFSINEIREKTTGISSKSAADIESAAQIFTVDAKKGDVFFETSDGIHDNLFDDEIEKIAKKFADDPNRMSQMLVVASKIRMGKMSLDQYPELKNIVRTDKLAQERAKQDDSTAGAMLVH